MLKRKWWIAVVFIVVVAALVWANIARSSGKTASGAETGPKNGPQVKVVKMEPQDLTQRVLAPGTLEATTPREVRAPFPTQRVKLLIGAGDKVTEGQVIAELEAEDLKVQVAQQEAVVARSESTLAQLRVQQQTSPMQLTAKLEAARAQLVTAEQGVTNAQKQADTARQRFEQAQSTLLAVQSRTSAGNAAVSAAQSKLQTAEADYRANPLSRPAQAAYEAAQAAYQDALRQATETARQLSVDLAQAYDNLALAERDLKEAGDDSAAVRQAKAQLESARQALAAAKTDVESGGVTADQVRSAEADLAAQRTSLENARTKLAQASLKAPVGGTILSVGIKSNQPAQQGQLLCEIGGLDLLTIRSRVDEVDIGKVKVGQTLAVKNNAYPSELFPGTVTRVAAQASAPTQGSNAGGTFYEVQGEVKNGEGKLRSGMSAEARMTTESRTKVMVAGLESIREEGDKAFVIVAKDFKIEVRPVKLGLRTQTQVEVLEGLQAGDQVVVAPFNLIKSFKGGEAVRVEVVPPTSRGDD